MPNVECKAAIPRSATVAIRHSSLAICNSEMNWFNTIALLFVTYLIVFFQATFNELRHFIGAQVDLLPSLIVYAALSNGVVTLSLVAVCGGLWVDSLSANPLGVTMLPLLVVGLLIQRSREFILRDQAYAQVVLGLCASAAVPLLTLLILFNLDAHPLVSWFSLWQWIVMSVGGAVVTPVWFRVFDWIGRVLNYRPVGESGFRPDREIKRGKQ
jgi:cell shape-determining protein MreD